LVGFVDTENYVVMSYFIITTMGNLTNKNNVERGN